MHPRSTSSLPVAVRQEDSLEPLSPITSHSGQALETESLLPLASSTSYSYTDSDSSESVSIGPSGQDPLIGQPFHQERHNINFISPSASALSELGLDNTKQESRHGLGHQQLPQQLQQPKHKHSLRSRLKAMVMHEPLLSATILGVLLGILLGSLIRLARPSRQAIDLIGKHTSATNTKQHSVHCTGLLCKFERVITPHILMPINSVVWSQLCSCQNNKTHKLHT